MIRYVRGTWADQLYRWRGGSIEKIWIQVLMYCIYCLLIFSRAGEDPVIGDKSGSMKILGGFATFSLVFSIQQCYSRYLQGLHMSASLFSTLLAMNTLACSYSGILKAGCSKGGLANLTPAELRLGIATQVHVARLTLALAVAFSVHRYIIESAVTGKSISDDQHVAILFELTRLRGLLLEAEVPLVDSATGLLVQHYKKREQPCCGDCGLRCCSCCCKSGKRLDKLCVNIRYKSGVLSSDLKPLFHVPEGGYWENEHRCRSRGYSGWEVLGVSLMLPISQLLRHHIGAACSQRWGFPERFVNLFEGHLNNVMSLFDQLEQLVSAPLPMAYLQQRKMLFVFFAAVYPLTVPNSDGWWTNVITPSLIFMAMMGFESVAEMLENPLGDDSLDLNVSEMIHDLEVRVSKALMFAEERIGSMEDASAQLLARMPLQEDQEGAAADGSAAPGEHAADLRRLVKEWGFHAHFVWRPVPPQVLVRSLEQMHAGGRQADAEMREIVLQHQEETEPDCQSTSEEEETVGLKTSCAEDSFCRMPCGEGGQPLRHSRRPRHSQQRTPPQHCEKKDQHSDRDSRTSIAAPHTPTLSAKELYRHVSLMRGRDSVGRQDLLGIDHFLCLRLRADALEVLLEEFGREYVRDKRNAGAGGRLLSRLHEMWWPL